ncbi:uncharacterized protein LOC118734977 [Rhagoletis pomonella]|uniref:uncharacterized protein LOC118734977 n=1 Tax=Rhagoletis pomonella TaxID=28610 RepID=UPI001786ACAD|nr:uncharacterized protein LOC118734977 [Rhagoletis pomonella]
MFSLAVAVYFKMQRSPIRTRNFTTTTENQHENPIHTSDINISQNIQSNNFPNENNLSANLSKSVKLPSFFEDCPEAWFLLVEVNNIRDDNIKFQNIPVFLQKE